MFIYGVPDLILSEIEPILQRILNLFFGFVWYLFFFLCGIYTFGRPYGPIIVGMLGLGVMVPIMILVLAYEEWIRRTVCLFSFTALLFKHRRTLRYINDEL